MLQPCSAVTFLCYQECRWAAWRMRLHLQLPACLLSHSRVCNLGATCGPSAAASLEQQEPLAAAGVPEERRQFEVTVANILQVRGWLVVGQRGDGTCS